MSVKNQVGGIVFGNFLLLTLILVVAVVVVFIVSMKLFESRIYRIYFSNLVN